MCCGCSVVNKCGRGRRGHVDKGNDAGVVEWLMDEYMADEGEGKG